MSRLSKKEKQALNDLFISLNEKKSILARLKRYTHQIFLSIRYKYKQKKEKQLLL